MKIYDRTGKSVIFKCFWCKTMKECIERAVKKGISLMNADLSEANLNGANLLGGDFRFADFHCASLTGVNLTGVNFRDANLTGAEFDFVKAIDTDFHGTNLIKASFLNAKVYNSSFTNSNLVNSTFFCADIRDTDLSGANIMESDFQFAKLIGVNFRDSNLTGSKFNNSELYCTDLSGANLTCVNLDHVYSDKVITDIYTIGISSLCPFGSFIGWKKAGDKVIKLLITKDSKRCNGTSRKCRCSKAKVMEIQELDGSKSVIKKVCSNYDNNFIYEVGKIVEVSNFDNNRYNECSTGIHFFIDRKDAVKYQQ